METQAAPHRANKRKPDSLEIPDPEGAAAMSSPAAANAPGAVGDQSHRQEPEPGASGGEEEDGVDRISGLPDVVLGEVISLLPIKDAARTQTLASRWRHLWRSTPLNLDCGEFLTGGGSLAGVVSRILSAHRGPGRRFGVPARVLCRQATMDAWLRSPALDNLKEIDFWVESWAPPWLQLPPLPASTLRFSSCLAVATVSQCHLSDDITQTIWFPRLKKLALQQVSISEDSLHSLIAGCPALECLLLNKSFGFRRVRINSASLKSIGLGAQRHEEVDSLEFIIEDAPCLERFLYLEQQIVLQVSVISAPKLETLGPLSDREYQSRLDLGSTIIQSWWTKGVHVIDSPSPVCTVKNLAVNIYTLSLDVIIDLMRCFPCLEKLYIQWYQGEDYNNLWFHEQHNNLWRRKHRDLIRCLDIRLKTIVLNNYQGTKAEVNFARFFVLNAKMLESMRFQCGCYNEGKCLLEDQHRLLQLEKRASKDARFYFTYKRCQHDFLHKNHACDLSITDPFECVETGVGVCASFE